MMELRMSLTDIDKTPIRVLEELVWTAVDIQRQQQKRAIQSCGSAKPFPVIVVGTV